MSKIRKEYITNPDFDPAKVANASSAAEGLCKWVLAMEIYDRVAKIVAPKKERMQLAEADLQKTLDHLSKKRNELKVIEERLLSLKQQFQDMTEKKEKLELQVCGWEPGALKRKKQNRKMRDQMLGRWKIVLKSECFNCFSYTSFLYVRNQQD